MEQVVTAAVESGLRPVISDRVVGSVVVDGRQESSGWLEHGRQEQTVWKMTATRPDMHWSQTDGAGHFHAWAGDGSLPTLLEQRDRVQCDRPDCADEDCGEYFVSFWTCRICRQRVEPQRLTDAGAMTVPGPAFWHGLVTGSRVISGMVSVRLTARGRVYFGPAFARTDTVEGGPGGVLVTTRLAGIGSLGVRQAGPEDQS